MTSPYKITRNRTRAIAVVHSHVTNNTEQGVIDLSNDLLSFRTSKTIKGPGELNIILVPRKNYLNLIFPNDLINLYIDPGDGKSGFIRTFLGYIDRVERTETTNDQTGAVTTQFVVTCTDFTKVIDRTEIYRNPSLTNRKELFGEFGETELGGVALYNSGIVVHGSPADMIESFLQVLLGFGRQWILPQQYPTKFFDKMKTNRINRSLQRLPDDIKKNLVNLGFGDLAQSTITPAVLNAYIAKAQKDLLAYKLQNNLTSTQKNISSQLLELIENSEALRGLIGLLNNTTNGSIMDLLDLDFIEGQAMDGYIFSAAVYNQSGTLASTLYSFANEIVNELFFDLRPVVVDSDNTCIGTTYSKESDELGINTDGMPNTPLVASAQAIQYQPAVIFREYPYSVVEGLDLSKYTADEQPYTFVPFGPIFAQGVGESGRKLYDYRTSGIESLAAEPTNYTKKLGPIKHLDVITIEDSDLMVSSVGRDDHAVFNLFSITPTDGIFDYYKQSLQEFLPIMIPISIQKNGLRVKEPDTKYANYDETALKGVGHDDGSKGTRRHIIRWTLLMDAWEQHNSEYLNGVITLRGMPEIRVGYRLDWLDRNESYYVEGVNHQWSYPDKMVTTVQVSRGQRNDPFPAYIPPILPKFKKITRVIKAPAVPTDDSPKLITDNIDPFIGFIWPLPTNSSRNPFISSGFGSRNQSPASWHAGADIEYPRLSTDTDIPVSVDGFNPKTRRPTGINGFTHRLSKSAFIPDGTIAIAAGPGTVISNSPNANAYSMVVINHNNGYYTVYQHMLASFVHVGQTVVAGSPIGLVGFDPSGRDTNFQYHLHFEVWKAGVTTAEQQIPATALNHYNHSSFTGVANTFPINPAPFMNSWSYNKPSTTPGTVPTIDDSASSETDPTIVETPTPTIETVFEQENKDETVLVVLGTEFKQDEGGGNRWRDGRLADYFIVKDPKATVSFRGTNRESESDNQLDTSPNADRGNHAEYAGMVKGK